VPETRATEILHRPGALREFRERKSPAICIRYFFAECIAEEEEEKKKKKEKQWKRRKKEKAV